VHEQFPDDVGVVAIAQHDRALGTTIVPAATSFGAAVAVEVGVALTIARSAEIAARCMILSGEVSPSRSRRSGVGGSRRRQVDTGVVQELDASVGATVIGRRTFDLGLGPWGGTPWPGVPSFVVTHRDRDDLLGDNGGTFAFDGLEAAARRVKDAAGDKDVVVLGADVARHLLRAGLLDEVRIHLVPLLMGEGTRLVPAVVAE